MSHLGKIVFISLFLGFFFLFISSDEKDTESSYAYLQFLPEGKANIRCILPEGFKGSVPKFFFEGEKKEDMRLRFDGSKYFVDEVKMFPVLVYEAEVSVKANQKIIAQCSDSRGSWTIPDFEQENIPEHVVIGDTGCKDYEQNCKENLIVESSSWNYPLLIRKILSLFRYSGEAGKFILHVGDYIYRGDNGAPLDKLVKDLSKTANWSDWEKDFFHPSSEALKEYPWIFVRGNHETYTRNSGLGWFLFLDPKKASSKFKDFEQGVWGLSPKKEFERELLSEPEPFFLSKKVKAIFLDTSTTNHYKSQSQGVTNEGDWFDRYAIEAMNLAEDGLENWVLTHVPPLELNEDGDFYREEDETVELMDGSRQAFLRKVDKISSYAFLKRFDVFVTGDVHSLQLIEPFSELPWVLIVGSGGVVLDHLGTCSANLRKIDPENPNCVASHISFNQMMDENGHWRKDYRSYSLPVDGKAWSSLGFAYYPGGDEQNYILKGLAEGGFWGDLN